MTARWASFLQIRPGEGARVGFVAVLFLLVQAGQGIAANAADSLFFIRFGVDYLPYMFMALGLLTFAATLIYSASLIRTPLRLFFTVLFFAFAGLLLAERIALVSQFSLVYPALWLSANIINSLLGVIIWFVAGEVLDTRQSKRLFPLFSSAGILGSVLGNLVTGSLAHALGTENLLILCAVLLAASWLTLLQIVARFWHPEVKRKIGETLVSDLTSGYEFVRRSRLLQLTAYASVLFSVLYFSISFPFSKAVAAAFPNEADLAGFLGIFSSAATIVTLIVSLLVANRVYKRFGIVNAIFLLPLVYLGGFVLWAGSFVLSTAVVVRLLQLVVLNGLASSAWWALFNVVPSEQRGQVLGFDADVQSAIGVVLSGVLLLLGERVLSNTEIMIMGMFVALVCALIVWRMRRAYGDALIHALRAGRFEVFGAVSRGLTAFQGNANALDVVQSALRDARPSTRRIAAEILGRVGDATAAPVLARATQDADPQVRLAALAALGQVDGHQAVQAVTARLQDSDPAVRACALEVLPAHETAAHPEWIETARSLLDDPDARVSAAAAVALAHAGQTAGALSRLEHLLCEAQVDARVRALQALGRLAAQIPAGQAHSILTPITQAVHDPVSLVRRTACEALAPFRGESAVQALVGCLNDPDEMVRRAAVNSLKQQGAAATPSLLQVLEGDESRAQEAALDALPANDPAFYRLLSVYARREIAQTRAWQELSAAIPPAGRVTRLLIQVADDRATASEARLVKTVGLLGNAEAMAYVVRSLKSRTGEHRAEAIEALETLGDKRLAREIIPLLDDAPAHGARLTPAEALAQLFTKRDAWTRALAAQAAAELSLRELIPNLHTLGQEEADPLPSQAARAALARLGEQVPMETLQTVSPLERMILLREVPLFAELSPDDLKQIADVAREQWYPDGEVLCREGEEGRELYVIVSGKVAVNRQVDGAERNLAHRAAGDSIGEMAILDSEPRSATVRAEGDVRALVLSDEAFTAILRDRPEVSLAVLRVLSKRLREK